jgi:hypothetical protein
MRKRTLAALVIVAIALSGCESHQARVDALQKQYDESKAQFTKDCGDEATARGIDPINHAKLSPKCTEEEARTTEAWKQLEAERTKK